MKPTDKNMATLRHLAEAEFTRKLKQAPKSKLPPDAVLQELQIHQIELEMQNEELRHSYIQLAEAKKLYLDLYEFSPIGYLTLSSKGLITRSNLCGESLLGEPRKQLIGSPLSRFISQENSNLWHLSFKHALKTGEMLHCKLEIQHADGSITHVLLESKAKEVDEDLALLITLTDITQLIKSETELKHANRAYAALSEVNHDMMHFNSEYELLWNVCKVLVDKCGYLMAWIGDIQHDEQKSIKINAQAGNGKDYLKDAHFTWAVESRGMGTVGRAVRSGTTEVCQNIAEDPSYAPWRDEASKLGYLSSLSIPMADRSGNAKGCSLMTIYASEINAFTQSEVNLLEKMAADVFFGLRILQTRKERDFALEKNQQQLAQLQETLEGTVRAINCMVEIRDPYTAGHQSRVAALASAIASHMGLSEEQIHAIQLAGELHDLGKIQVPSEILSKPGKLSVTEFELIKVHVQAGYDVLKNINFPWPIAQLVLQHHERLDGSGYPNGIKGEAILLEARILAVADVVEAMASHRPYRAALGIDAALNEITSKRGSHFDPQVVDTCVALFREKGFSFSID